MRDFLSKPTCCITGTIYLTFDYYISAMTSHWRPANLLKRLAENDVPMHDWMNFVSPNVTSKI